MSVDQFSVGEIPILADAPLSDRVVILAHGAGSHMEHRTMQWLAGLVHDAGASVVRFNFLYRAQGRSMPDRMPVSVEAFRSVIEEIRTRFAPRSLIIGGHSYGGRVASMLEAEGKTADGLLLFGYPLHPPGKPRQLRDEHLPKIKTPTLQLNGTNDELCTQSIMNEIAQALDPKIWTLRWIEGADHSYGVKKSSGRTKKDVEADISIAVQPWIEALTALGSS